ncbi:unnamed protein product [Macrosiphum euphorbiae]|uniref:Uncharacterized protein n=1 Tax=Macrosiphum euphorbiae TaxID=13131 RepID=A0AAV0XZA1_9HEMI|nr:unnamed protein product [Macrosiphum euphorbiae]
MGLINWDAMMEY